MFGKKPKLGKEIKDTKSEYYGDTGKVTDYRFFEKANKEYVVVEWDEDSIHGGGFRNYRKEEFGKRFRYV